ncbi:hypothetical protein [Pelovirga terrestris]|uniref:Uncharacterized protein n=1 Tax=Pelovirga terrestris TaxID=2771352 RepID=A0A8J6UNS1_9BACT|nr:hypothetical protein [Pelovirga terrestris]MBD1399989.1 hypothetical protein [Pelovirga terrestris]
MTPSAIKNTAAFWISPEGMILPVKTNHIDFVIQHPALFAADLDVMRQRYQIHNEPWGSEGKARHEIICDLVLQGWIRIRRYRHSYSINVRQLDNIALKRLSHFARLIADTGVEGSFEADLYMPCNIIELHHHHQHHQLTFSQLQEKVQ